MKMILWKKIVPGTSEPDKEREDFDLANQLIICFKWLAYSFYSGSSSTSSRG